MDKKEGTFIRLEPFIMQQVKYHAKMNDMYGTDFIRIAILEKINRLTPNTSKDKNRIVEIVDMAKENINRKKSRHKARFEYRVRNMIVTLNKQIYNGLSVKSIIKQTKEFLDEISGYSLTFQDRQKEYITILYQYDDPDMIQEMKETCISMKKMRITKDIIMNILDIDPTTRRQNLRILEDEHRNKIDNDNMKRIDNEDIHN